MMLGSDSTCINWRRLANVLTVGLSVGWRSNRLLFFFFFQAEDGIRDVAVTGVQTCALPILRWGLFFVAEYGEVTVVSSIIAALWLGGWHGPFTDIHPLVGPVLGVLWFTLKTDRKSVV